MKCNDLIWNLCKCSGLKSFVKKATKCRWVGWLERSGVKINYGSLLILLVKTMFLCSLEITG